MQESTPWKGSVGTVGRRRRARQNTRGDPFAILAPRGLAQKTHENAASFYWAIFPRAWGVVSGGVGLWRRIWAWAFGSVTRNLLRTLVGEETQCFWPEQIHLEARRQRKRAPPAARGRKLGGGPFSVPTSPPCNARQRGGPGFGFPVAGGSSAALWILRKRLQRVVFRALPILL